MSTDEPRTALSRPLAEAKALGSPMIVRGILGVVFGLATVFWPRDSANPTHLTVGVDVVDLLSIGYLVLFALALVYQALRAPLTVRTAMLGQAVITIPAIVFLFLADQPAEARAALSIWALLHGVLEYLNYRGLKSQPMASDFLISAGCHGLLGVILIAGDDFEALAILGFAGAAALIAGVIFIIGGYSRLSRAKQVTAVGGDTDGGATTDSAADGGPTPDTPDTHRAPRPEEDD
ncbi:uncharacterized membrane protein HdeD (DUF308 family) [Brevibacterium sanguinis]|uniref:Uncharacterized membrane protein HdeD (DUF308 family) n=2 Tax=Brevibacterium TaxID=1696 RepID=A0A366IPW5_9MICO|nr:MULTISPECIES: hypothetical protein [Brevibacterium]RBP67138.1 uncharacterized membrane protein HdeD (DUF308 family) [Brevibacterium sanguinis]RBP73663.1 uncharacterized membrane protein HdeD (DUF308 family) [Brevibacterium celere]